ncbi:MAG: ATP-dependent DNA helicase RecG [Saprospiraceae bacterium]
MTEFLSSSIAFLKGVGPQRASWLSKEWEIHRIQDLLQLYPYRHIDRTQIISIKDCREEGAFVQVKGILRRLEQLGEGSKKRLAGVLRDETGSIDLIWFTGISYLYKQFVIGQEYIIYGKLQSFRDQFSISHPEMEPLLTENQALPSSFYPMYSGTEKSSKIGIDNRFLRKVIKGIIERLNTDPFPEVLPYHIIKNHNLISSLHAYEWIHFPKNQNELDAARARLKFEELFFLQLSLLQLKFNRRETVIGYNFTKIGDYFNTFYHQMLAFELTDAQKRVLKEIRRDLATGKQMNRLLQGDVGSGKTVVGFMTMLMALDNGFQALLMAPTEILAQQHYAGLSIYGEQLGIQVAFLTGSVKGKKRNEVLAGLENGSIAIVIGTHALLEDPVRFKNLGLAITDEQHRFGVEQRSKLWHKSKPYPPHVLVMTATPIPRTLAMTVYGDLDISVIDTLPPGRKPIQTLHKNENHRLWLIGFMKEQIKAGRQIYVVYPLIEESEKMDLNNLMEGFESLSREFPNPHFGISMVHGKMKPADKEWEMQQFVKGNNQIMVATTVIEVGVNVPNASVMIIENTERFGLSQLHQLRGRVGRGAEQSFCILMSSFKLSSDSRERINTLVRTNNGFDIAEADLRLRGPGNLDGKQQSGTIQLKLADLSKDGAILDIAREEALAILNIDPTLSQIEHKGLKYILHQTKETLRGWGRIS